MDKRRMEEEDEGSGKYHIEQEFLPVKPGGGIPGDTGKSDGCVAKGGHLSGTGAVRGGCDGAGGHAVSAAYRQAGVFP